MRQIRTDLAMESARAGDLPGVTISGWEAGDVHVTEVKVDPGEGSKLLGKPPGSYVTLEMSDPRAPESREALANLLGEELARMLPAEDGRPVLVVGLGNRDVTPDALGPKVVSETLVTRHIFRELPDAVDARMRSVCAVAPGVLGVTGVETLEMAKGIVEHVGPRVAIVIDALAARAASRLGTTVQIADTGIQPGSGVGNHRSALTQETLGVPVIAIGVPMVIYAATIVRDALEGMTQGAKEEAADAIEKEVLGTALGEMIVTPREIDDLVKDSARMLASGINRALHPGLSDREISELMA